MLIKCAGPGCDQIFEAPEGSDPFGCFCSIECACYAGRFSVREGWLPKRRSLPEGYPAQFSKNEAVVRRGLVPIEECPAPSWACVKWGDDDHDWVACDECRPAYELWVNTWLGEVE